MAEVEVASKLDNIWYTNFASQKASNEDVSLCDSTYYDALLQPLHAEGFPTQDF